MTRQESLGRRIRERMESAGERDGAERRVLPNRSAGGTRTWVSRPEMTDEAVLAATGRGWDAWCDVLDAWPGDAGDHGAIVDHLQAAHGVPGWWAQTVAVGYERITGRRLPFQRADGTFSAGKTRTVTADSEALRRMLLDDRGRSDLFPGLDTELRSRPTSKNVRLGIGPGTAEIAMDARAGGRVTVTVAHERLPSPDDVDRWKAYWAAWLEAIDDA